MELDLYCLGQPLRDVPALAAEAERLGFSGLWFTESSHSPFLLCGAAALATDRIRFGTDIAVAFPRSPMVTAQAAWDLSQASDGRFILGLGSQVKAHVERRFSTPFSRPAARLREYVLALRAIWSAFQGRGSLKFAGDFYHFSLLTDFFSGGPIDHPDIPVFIAGVNTGMARVAGEVCDGFHVHPLHSPEYLRNVVRPAIDEGAALAGRTAADISMAVPVFIAVGERDDDVERQRRSIRRQIGFYGSTPSYRAVFEAHGWGDLATALNRLQRRRDPEGVLAAVTDEVADAFAVTASWDTLAAKLLERYRGLADRIFPYGLTAWDDVAARERWAGVAADVRRG